MEIVEANRAASAACPRCQAVLQPGGKFCIRCGAAVEMPVSEESTGATGLCSQCGQPIAQGKRFCSQCGALQANRSVASTKAGRDLSPAPAASGSHSNAASSQPFSLGAQIPGNRRPRLAMLLIGSAFLIAGTGGVLEYMLAGSATRQAAAPITSEISLQVIAEKVRPEHRARSGPARATGTGDRDRAHHRAKWTVQQHRCT